MARLASHPGPNPEATGSQEKKSRKAEAMRLNTVHGFNSAFLGRWLQREGHRKIEAIDRPKFVANRSMRLPAFMINKEVDFVAVPSSSSLVYHSTRSPADCLISQFARIDARSGLLRCQAE